MAMLAEPKRRKKWSLNPRGKMWVNDETKIGQKLLEKMGWSKGKGLGREEQGDLEPVRLQYKNDAEGVGYKARDDQWVAHHDEFNAILGQLHGIDAPVQTPESIPVKSLEVRSKTSKARVHYHKFTRGKDLSRYSATDLACILGKRAAGSPPQSEDKVEERKEEEENEKPEADGGSDVEHSHGVTTIRKGNINEYFASKMAALKAKNQTVAAAVSGAGEETLNGAEGDSDSDGRNEKRRVRFNEELNMVKEFCSKKKIIDGRQDDVCGEDTDETPQLETKEEKSLRKKKKRKEARPEEEDGEAVILESIAGEGVEEEALPEEAFASPQKTKKKKKKKAKMEKENCSITEEKAEDIVGAIETDPAEMPAAEEKEKKKKRKKKEEGEETPKMKEKKSSKKKKKEEKSSGSGSSSDGGNGSQEESEPEGGQSAAEEVIEEAPAAVVEGADKSEKKKTKKKRKREPDGTEGVQPTESPGSDHHQEEHRRQDTGPSSEKKRKADDDDEEAAAGGVAAAAAKGVAPDDIDSTDHVGKRYKTHNFTCMDGSALSNPMTLKKTVKRYELAEFERFKGSNLYRIAGYGYHQQ